MGLWSDLPGDLLRKIEENLVMYHDKIRFRCVCTHWQSSSPLELPDLRKQQPLLLPYKGSSFCGLYLPFENKVYHIDLPEVGEAGFIGSGHGWVITLQQNGSMHVVNPLSRVCVLLPTLPNFTSAWRYIKILLSSSPASTDFRAVAINHQTALLSYCKLGDEEEWHEFGPPHRRYKDATFYRGKLYALAYELFEYGSRLMICDDIVSSPDNLRECPLSSNKKIQGCYHLVNSCRGLMAVEKFGVRAPSSSFLFSTITGFGVFKLDGTSNDAGWRWTPMENLDTDDQILFMGCGTELGVSSRDFRGSRGNRIYFVNNVFDHHKEYVMDGSHIGVYSFEDKRCEPLRYECNSKLIWPCPIWFTPNPYS